MTSDAQKTRAKIDELKQRLEFIADRICKLAGLPHDAMNLAALTDGGREITQFGFKLTFDPAQNPYMERMSLWQLETMDEATGIIWSNRFIKHLTEHIAAITGAKA